MESKETKVYCKYCKYRGQIKNLPTFCVIKADHVPRKGLCDKFMTRVK
jgi:hypothetical protein